MAYLTFEEYKDRSMDPVTEEEFNKLLIQAQNVIDVATRRFYLFNNFEADHDWRKDAVKTATTYQIDYFNEVGGTTHESLNQRPQSWSAGRTNVTNSSGRIRTGAEEKKSLLAVETQSALLGTGLLYRGVRTWKCQNHRSSF